MKTFKNITAHSLGTALKTILAGALLVTGGCWGESDPASVMVRISGSDGAGGYQSLAEGADEWYRITVSGPDIAAPVVSSGKVGDAIELSAPSGDDRVFTAELFSDVGLATPTYRGRSVPIDLLPDVQTLVRIDVYPLVGQAVIEDKPYFTDSVIEVTGSLRVPSQEVVLSYEWYVNDNLVPDATGASLGGEHFNKGDKVHARIVPRFGDTAGDATRSNTVTIRNSKPTAPKVRIDPALPSIYQTSGIWVTVYQPAVDADGDPVSYRFDWLRNGESAGLPQHQAFISKLELLDGDHWQVQVTATDGSEDSEPGSASKYIEMPVSNGMPTVFGIGKRNVCYADSAGNAYCAGDGRWGQLTGGIYPDTYGEGDPLPPPGGQLGAPSALSPLLVSQIITEPPVEPEHLLESSEYLLLSSVPRGVVDLAVGDYHICALSLDSSVRCWGDNTNGQAGPHAGTLIVDEPVSVPGLEIGVMDLSAGAFHTCALLADNTVACWGSNAFGQLGPDVQAASSATPVVIPGLQGVKAVSTGAWHSCAVLSDGSLKCWGANGNNQLGTDTVPVSPTPLTVDLPPVKAVATGEDFTCAVELMGGTFCWGANDFGQLGTGNFDPATMPTYTEMYDDVVEIVAGGHHVCTLTTYDELYCWGDNGRGQLADGPSQYLTKASPDYLGYDLQDIYAGGDATCVLGFGGYPDCFGDNTLGQMGTYGGGTRFEPVDYWGAANGIISISAGDAHGCYITASAGPGQLACWGNNDNGQLGNGGRWDSEYASEYDFVENTRLWNLVEAGANHTCAIEQTGLLWCWGDNRHGQLGIGSIDEDRLSPALVTTQVTWHSVGAGRHHTCAVNAADDTMQCWGDNTYGQLGTDTAMPGFVTQPVETGPVSWSTSGIDRPAVTAGDRHTCAISIDYRLYCWGDNSRGQLGIGAMGGTFASPQEVTGMHSDWNFVVAGAEHTCGVRNNSDLYCWGKNSDGQLGDGTTTHRAMPVRIGSAVGDWTSLALGERHTCGTVWDGTDLWCWGGNTTPGRGITGQLGLGLVEQALTPQPVTLVGNSQTPSPMRPIAGRDFTCQADAGMYVSCWGSNDEAQLGEYSTPWLSDCYSCYPGY